MSLTFSFASIRDVLSKLERDSTRMRTEEMNGDRFFDFVVTAYSMIDWVKRDPSVPASAKQPHEIQWLYSNQWIKVCGDLATAVKHFALTTRHPTTSATTSETGFGVGRFGMGGYGVGEESIELTLNDGTKLNALDVVQGAISAWKTFFQVHSV
jgi:hypothetical protein